jgi:hypothetical protein
VLADLRKIGMGWRMVETVDVRAIRQSHQQRQMGWNQS